MIGSVCSHPVLICRVDSGEVSDTPVGMHSLPSAAPEGISLFSTPQYPPTAEDLPAVPHDRMPSKMETDLQCAHTGDNNGYNEDDGNIRYDRWCVTLNLIIIPFCVM